MSAKVISIVNQKGGVGKTTTAINLATSLCESGKRVLIIDFDPQANATSGVGLRADKIEKNVYHLLTEKVEVAEVLYPTPFDNMQVLPATKDLAGAEIEMVELPNRESLLKKGIKEFRDYYDFIIIDCPPSLGLLTLNALVASDEAIIPLQCEYFAMEGIAGLVNTLSLVKESFNPELSIGGILLTMYDKRTALNKQVVDNARKFFEELVFETVIPRNIRLSEAPSHGMPISLYEPGSRGAIAYSEFAKEVLSRV